MIASAVQGEGKTLTATNLALTFSESYQRSVLLIDADLRRPSLHTMFGIENTTGLSDGLACDEPRDLSVRQVSPRLAILPAGQPEPGSDGRTDLGSDARRRRRGRAGVRLGDRRHAAGRACCPTPTSSLRWSTARCWS